MKVLHRFKSGNQRLQILETEQDILGLLWEGEELKNAVRLDPQEFGVEVLSEFFYGPDDTRLPDDVKDLPVGKREDFVDEFNFWSSVYRKDNDPDYDENQTRAENRVRFGLAKAYKFIAPPEEEDAPAAIEGGLLGTLEWIEHEGEKVAHLSEVSHGPFAANRASEAQISSNVDGSFDHPITILEGGWSLNDRYYTQEAVAGIARFAEQGRVSFFNHGETFNRDPRDWGAMVTEAFAEGTSVRGTLHVFAHDNGPWMQERIEKAANLFGVSIDAFARVEEGEREGREGLIVTEIVALNSVDIVMFPGARGAFDAVESCNSLGESNMDLAKLKSEHPDLVAALEAEFRVKVEAEFATKEADLQNQVDAGTAKVEELTTENADLKSKVDEFETKEAERKFKADLKKLIETELPESARRPNDKGEIPFMTICEELGPDHLETTIAKLVADRKRSLGSTAVEGEGDRTLEEAEGVTARTTESVDDLAAIWNGTAATA